MIDPAVLHALPIPCGPKTGTEKRHYKWQDVGQIGIFKRDASD